MQFFLYEIVARIVAIYLFFDCGRTVWSGYLERKIRYFNTDFLDFLLDWSSPRVVHRDAAPVRYWILMVNQAIIFVACFFVAIFGWWHPDT